ncbi:hypothetical protein BC936DRAFT_141059 [Jimgerdemannia flammicorona]|uniref:Uncharacterized protein n=1 Tax=Jimgerdemannia flammicorona TaxID=994334 RepID=A0A433DGG7_9FUNG|nr:hypothetical protein BC936DRAFT_141059 [Jimgerdemannia flammicorona]
MQHSSNQRSSPQVAEPQKLAVEVQDNTITAASTRDKMDEVVKFLKNVAIGYGDETERRERLEHDYSEALKDIKQLQKEVQHWRSEAGRLRSEASQLRKENDILKEDRDRLRVTVIGTDFEAWNLSAVLKKFDSLRQRWLSLFLFEDNAKNGELLSINMTGVFGATQNIIKSRIETIRESMFDVKVSPTNIQFVIGVLQSNYKMLEQDLREQIHEKASKQKPFLDLRESFLKINQHDGAQKQFDALVDDMIEVSGKLILCDRKSAISSAYNRNNGKSFEIRFTSSEKQVVCFPGICYTDEKGVIHWKSKVWIAVPPSSDHAIFL